MQASSFQISVNMIYTPYLERGQHVGLCLA